jgi:AraC-like DNA-binding protein
MLTTSDQQFITRITDIILENLKDENFGVKKLAILSGISRSTLNHKLQSILHKNLNQFIRELRLQKALEMLQNESITASEVAFKVGFSSPAYFNKCFHEFFGYPPGRVEKNGSYNNESNAFTGYISSLLDKISARLAISITVNTILILVILILIVAILLRLK